jgi:hypothetical protein
MPFHSRDVDHVLSMNYDFLDTNLDDFTIDNIPEDQQLEGDEQEMAAEDNEFQNRHHEGGQSDQSRTKHSKGHHKKNGNWSTENLETALNNIDDGMPIQFAAKLASILASSVQDHYTGKTRGRKRGPAGVLTPKGRRRFEIEPFKNA